MSNTGHSGEIISLLQLLVSPDTPKTSTQGEKSMDSFNFEKLLEKNTERFLEELGKPKFEGVKQKLTESEALLFRESKLDSIKWIFVKKCLTALYVLHKTLEVSMKVFLEANQERGDLKPSQAPPLSPDTLGMGQQKTIQTTLQFVVILAICPNLNPGVGVPIERRSEFGKLVSKSGEETEEGMKNDCLFMTSKVLMACAESPSLGSLILSRHLNDLLAMLLQLVHTFDAVKSKSKNPLNREVEQSENLKQSLDGNDTDVKGVESRKHISAEIADVEVAEEKGQESSVGSDVEGVGQKEVGSTVSEQSHDARPENAGGSSSVVEESIEDVNKSSSQPDIDLDLCKTLLADLMQRVRPPLLVRELLVLQAGPGPKMGPAGKPILQRAPTWLRKTCGRLLTDILIKPKGVLNVVQGMLADVSGGTSTSKLSDWRKCDAVAKVIACCPMQQTSMEEYYRQITPQIFELINIQEKTVARDFLRVACTTISYMASQNFQLTKELVIDPMIEPLMRCTHVTDAKPVGRVIVTDTEISQCVENIHRVFISGMEPHSEFITALLPVFHPLFYLYCYIREGVSYLRKICAEILVTILKQLDSTVSLGVLKFVTLDKETKEIQGKCHHLHPSMEFAAGEKGGVKVVTKDTDRNGLSNIETIVPGVVSLLKELQTDGVAGEFLLLMLKSLTDIITGEVQSPGVRISAEGLHGDVIRTERERTALVQDMQNKLIILQLLALMCEDIGPTCLKNTQQTLDFVKVTLERGIQVCENTEDEMTTFFESETLTMAMGLLTAVLSGALKITDKEMEMMNGMLPLLDDISRKHHDPSVKEMTSDLRIAIATRGTVWSENLKTAKENLGEKKVKKEVQKVDNVKSASRNRPLIEVISSKDNDKEFKTDETKVEAQDSKIKRSADADNSDILSEDKKKTLSVKENASDVNSEAPVDGKSSSTDPKHKRSGNEVSDTGDVLDDCRKSDPGKDSQKKTELQCALDELIDPLLPVRGHALISLSRLVKRRDPETLTKKDMLLKIFLENVGHFDSYLYLASVNGLVAMADSYPDVVVPKLAEEFTVRSDRKNERSSETRMKIGECLVQTSKALGDVSPKYRDILLVAFLSGCRDEDDLIRASSLSNLGELCKVLRFSLGKYLHEVFECCSALLLTDKSAEVRKAACIMITLLLRGLGKDALKLLDTLLRDLYRLLKLVMSSEVDPGVQTQANLAYNELDEIMKDFLFPKQTLQKRIKVLDPE